EGGAGGQLHRRPSGHPVDVAGVTGDIGAVGGHGREVVEGVDGPLVDDHLAGTAVGEGAGGQLQRRPSGHPVDVAAVGGDIGPVGGHGREVVEGVDGPLVDDHLAGTAVGEGAGGQLQRRPSGHPVDGAGVGGHIGVVSGDGKEVVE